MTIKTENRTLQKLITNLKFILRKLNNRKFKSYTDTGTHASRKKSRKKNMLVRIFPIGRPIIGTIENHWKPLKNCWKSLKNHWKSMIFNAFQWFAMIFNEFQWFSIIFNIFQWFRMIFKDSSLICNNFTMIFNDSHRL